MGQTSHYSRHVVIVFVDDSGPSASAALRYARSLRPTRLRAEHLVIDSQQAERLRAAWPPDRGVPLEFVDCPERGLTHCTEDFGPPRGRIAGRAGECDLARAQFLAADRWAAARPHGRQDRRCGEPGAQRRDYHRPDGKGRGRAIGARPVVRAWPPRGFQLGDCAP